MSLYPPCSAYKGPGIWCVHGHWTSNSCSGNLWGNLPPPCAREDLLYDEDKQVVTSQTDLSMLRRAKHFAKLAPNAE